ncbi:DUF4232 domain-containing protein [Streptomyces sp. AGS-58]|uniref:DUF4232 domain-containing protein n=1 Tax=unclassified Streptomyces TaxID=2593676 RepID=UPI0035A2CE2A
MRLRHIRLIAATGTAVTALALTACGSGTGTDDEGAARPTVATEQAAPGTPRATGEAAHTGGGATAVAPAARTHAPGARSSTSQPAARAGQGTGTGGSIVLCNGANTTVTAQPLDRPLDHMLLKVTNTGGKSCELPSYPVLRFDRMQWVPQADESTQPQAVVTLAPGESGYAGVLLSAADGSGTGGRTGHQLTVAFQGLAPDSGGGPSASPALPAKGVYYDSALKVTYWQQDLDAISGW